MTDEKDAPELDIIQDGKLPDEPVEQAGEVPEAEEKEKAPEAEDASQDDDSSDDTAADDGKAEKGKKAKPKVQERIDKLTWQAREAERRAERLEAELERARRQPVAADATAPDPAKYEQGEADPNYISELVVYKLEQRQAKARQAEEKESEESRKSEAAKGWAERTAEAASRYEDYEAVAFNKTLPVSQAMADTLLESDVGPDVLYWLGKNPAEARRISTLTPVKQAIEIGKIETLIEGDEGVAQPPKRLTAAPKPAKRLEGKVTPMKDPSKMSMDEYKAFRAKKSA